jgi:transposase
MKIPRREYTTEFKEVAVQRVLSGHDVVAVAQELGLVKKTLSNWVWAAKAGKLKSAGNKEVTPEQMEMSRLRAENVRLKMHVDILKKATAYFAKDVT